MIRVEPSFRFEPPTTHQEVTVDLEVDGQQVHFTAIIEKGHEPFSERITVHRSLVLIELLDRRRAVVSSRSCWRSSSRTSTT